MNYDNEDLQLENLYTMAIKTATFQNFFFSNQAPARAKKNINEKQIGVDQDGWLFNTYFKFTIFQFRSQCPLQELQTILLDELELELQLVHRELGPDLR